MAKYFLPVEFDKYIVLDQDLLPFPIQIFTGLAFLYQFSYGPGHRGHNMKYAYAWTLSIDKNTLKHETPFIPSPSRCTEGL